MSNQLANQDQETRQESELHKEGARMVESMFTMPGTAGDTQVGDSFYNNLERHTHVNKEHLLYGVLLGTIGDITNSYKLGRLKNRVDMCQTINIGWMVHLYQASISNDREGRKEAVEVLKAIALERQATLEALGNKTSRLSGLKQAITGHK